METVEAGKAKAGLGSTTSDPYQIYNCAIQCNAIFRQIRSLHKSRAGSVGLPKGDSSSTVMQQNEQRFWAWATGLGVFARPNLSLDSKLQSHDEVKELVMMLLGILRSNLAEALDLESTVPGAVRKQFLSKEPQSVGSLPAIAAFPLDRKALQMRDKGQAGEDNRNINPRIREALYGIDGALNRLDRLSIMIRKASKSNLNAKVRNFAKNNPDEDFDRITRLVLRYCFPNLTESLSEQLHDSTTHRRHRLLYERKHRDSIANSHRTLRSNVEGKEVTEHELPAKEAAVAVLAVQRSLELRSQTESVMESQSGRSPLDTNAWKNASSPPASVASYSSFSTVATGHVDYPAPPKVEDGMSLVQCPICYATLSATTVISRAKWRRHVDEDLEPWVCLSEECTHPLVFFTKSRSWREHMQNSHTENWPQLLHNKEAWACGIDHDNGDPPTFHSADALVDHILHSHERIAAAIGTDEVHEFAERSRIQKPNFRDICPICGIHMLDVQRGVGEYTGDRLPADSSAEEFPQKLSKHVAQHLKMLAFRSLNGILEQPEDIDEQSSRIINGATNDSDAADKILEADFDSDSMSIPYSDDVKLDERQFPDIIESLYTIQQKMDDNTEIRELCLEKEPQSRPAPEWAFIREPTQSNSTNSPDIFLENLECCEVQDSSELTSPNTRDLCLLSIDSGGVRGISTLYILKDIMDQLNKARKEDFNLPPVKPCEIFDLIGGAGSGGLIAIMLGRLEMSVDECIAEYTKTFVSVLKSERSSTMSAVKRFLSRSEPSKYGSARLEKAIRQTIQRSGKDAEELLDNGVDHRCKTFVCAYNIDSSELVRIRSHSSPTERQFRPKIWQAARATSASPMFFDPVVIGDETFLDGEIGANSTAREVESEATRIWCQESGILDSHLLCFISIETQGAELGRLLKKLSPPGREIYVPNRVNVYFAHEAKLAAESRFFRFVAPNLSAVGLDEYKEMNTLVREISAYLSSLDAASYIQRCVDRLKHKAALAENKRKAILFLPYPRNGHHVGRQKELARLRRMIKSDHEPSRIAITGLGGVGKTQLALELAYMAQNDDKYCSIFWLPADGPHALEESCSRLSRALGIPESPYSHASTLVQEYLNKEETGRWLLVLDNVQDFEAIRHFWSSISRGCIIFTTQIPEQACHIVADLEVMELRVMDQHDAVALVKTFLAPIEFGFEKLESDSEQLVEKLGYLPLAIVHALSYVRMSELPLAEFLALMEDQDRNVSSYLLDSPFTSPGNYSKTLRTIYDLALAQINSLATEYLFFMACVQPDLIPLSLLPPGPGDVEASVAIRSLSDRQLVTFHESDTTLSMHRSLHFVIRQRLDESNTLEHWTHVVMKRLVEVLSSPSLEHSNSEVAGKYIVHSVYVLKHGSMDTGEKSRAILASMVGEHLYAEGHFEEAENFLYDALNGNQMISGTDLASDLGKVRALSTLASLKTTEWRRTDNLESLTMAEELQREALYISTRFCGEEHPLSLRCIRDLGKILWTKGRITSEEGLTEEAQILAQKSLVLQEKILGIEHSATLASADDLSIIMFQQGRLDEAEELAVRSLETSLRVLGKEQPASLTRMTNLALIWKMQGKLREAVELIQECVRMSQRILGSEHPETVDLQEMLQTISYKGYEGQDDEEQTNVEDKGKGKNVIR